MIGHFMPAIRKELAATGCPIAVEYGLEKFEIEPTHDVAFVRDGDLADRWPVAVQAPGRREGKPHFGRLSGTLLTVYARSTKPGATEEDHHVLALRYVGKLMIVIRQALEADHAAIVPDPEGGFEPPPEGTTQITGARYTLKFQIANSVVDEPWPVNDPANIAKITTTITAKVPGLDDSTEECSQSVA